jgi:lysophospholipase L1-like esterase
MIIIAAALAATTPETAAQTLPVHVGGRVIASSDGSLGFGWPGVYLESRFRGDAVRVRFETGDETLRVLVDGEEKARFDRSGVVDRTFSGLGAGEHVIRLEKLTESQAGGSRLIGFYPVGGSSPLKPRARARQIEFIGDSHTVGYGNTSRSRQCTEREVHDLTDTQQAFGPLAARGLDADYRIIAYSGRGVVRNYAGVAPGESMIALYPRAKPDEQQDRERVDHDWKPQVIVIDLGTNDFSTPLHAGENWTNEAALHADYQHAYVDFVRRLHSSEPWARFVLMASDQFFDDVERVAVAVNTTSPGLATTLKFGNLELTACNWHPSLADDRKLANMLAPLVQQAAGWK